MQKKTSSSGIDGVIRKQYTSMYADLLYSIVHQLRLGQWARGDGASKAANRVMEQAQGRNVKCNGE